jgi:flagellin
MEEGQMPININTNVSSLFAQRSLNKAQGSLGKSLERLTTGLRINSAADDAAGLAISTRFQSQIRSLEQSQRNANDGISVIQTAEGSLEQMSNMLIRMRELFVQSSNGSLNNSDRDAIHQEFGNLISELDRIAGNTDFNGVSLLNGSASAGLTFQVGINNTANDKITVSIANLQTSKIGAGGSFVSGQSVSTAAKAQSSLGVIDGALDQISNARAGLGATQNRLSVTIDNLGSMVENLSSSNARIMDADVAKETANLTKNQILVQAGVSVLAQANQQPQIALSLLG